MHIEHVTLTTGHTRMSPREEVEDSTIAFLAPLMTRALRGELVEIPWAPGYVISGGVQGRCCMVTLERVTDGIGPFSRIPVISMGIAADETDAAEVWRTLHDLARFPSATDPDFPPPAPWILDVLHPASIMSLDVLQWTADLSRCLAWTWIEQLCATPAELE